MVGEFEITTVKKRKKKFYLTDKDQKILNDIANKNNFLYENKINSTYNNKINIKLEHVKTEINYSQDDKQLWKIKYDYTNDLNGLLCTTYSPFQTLAD